MTFLIIAILSLAPRPLGFQDKCGGICPIGTTCKDVSTNGQPAYRCVRK